MKPAGHQPCTVYLFGVIPLLVVAIGRYKICESERFVHLKAMRTAVANHDDDEVARLLVDLLERLDGRSGGCPAVGRLTVSGFGCLEAS